MWPRANDVTLTMWRLWLGFNVSHGLGAFMFGLLCLLIAVHDFALVESIDAIRPLTIAVAAAYLALSLRFWFYVPAIVTGAATACFTVAAILSAGARGDPTCVHRLAGAGFGLATFGL